MPGRAGTVRTVIVTGEVDTGGAAPGPGPGGGVWGARAGAPPS